MVKILNVVIGLRHKRLIKRLSRTNEPLSEAQETEIDASLQQLYAEFERIVGRPFDSCADNDDYTPRGAKQYRVNIRVHRALLSHIRSLPEEILQTVFLFATFEEIFNPGRQVRTICAVSRRWRAAAINHCALWTLLPVLSLQGGVVTERKIQNTVEVLQLHLQRSGILPLEIDCIITASAWKSHKASIQKILQLLTTNCHRWGVVSFSLPADILAKSLAPIQGRIPLLSKLTLSIYDRIDFISDTIHIHYFSEAPALRSVWLCSYAYNPSIFNFQIVKLNLPWSQVEEFNGESRGGDAFYRDLLAAQSSRLRSLTYMLNGPRVPPLPSARLPKLESLSVHLWRNSGDFPSHLKSLIAPALSSLSLLGSMNPYPPNTLTLAISGMIQSSGCSLRELSMKNIDIKLSAFTDILNLCPSLVKLGIPHLGSEGLQRLILDPSSPCPVLPQLKTLHLCTAYRRGIFRNNPAPPAAIDAATLMRMVRSRTVDLSENIEYANGAFSTLEEITLFRCELRNLYVQLLQLEMPVGDAVLRETGDTGNATAVELGDVASMFSAILGNQYFAGIPRDSKPRRDWKLHLGPLDRQMQEMENFNLEEYLGYTPILSVRPTFLRGYRMPLIMASG